MNGIYNRDCLKFLEDVKEKYDCVLTSPPYPSLKREYQSFENWSELAEKLYTALKPGGVMIWNEGNYRVGGKLIMNSWDHVALFRNVGFDLHQEILATKFGIPYGNNSICHNAYEPVYVLSKGKLKTFNRLNDVKTKNINQKVTGIKRGSDFKLNLPQSGIGNKYKEFHSRSNVWGPYSVGLNHTYRGFEREICRNHSALMPIQLVRDLVFSYTNVGDFVFDPFGGLGTTAVVCAETGRSWEICDIKPIYCKDAELRLELCGVFFCKYCKSYELKDDFIDYENNSVDFICSVCGESFERGIIDGELAK